MKNQELIGNNDDPESGLDGLMQAMVCHDEIGWRNESHRLIIYSSDSTFHLAGDGRLAGIITPHDEKCHLVNNETYSHEEILDYPSINQINRIAKQNKFNIIFAIKKQVFKIYKELSKRIKGSAVDTILNMEAKGPKVDFVSIVREQYKVSLKWPNLLLKLKLMFCRKFNHLLSSNRIHQITSLWNFHLYVQTTQKLPQKDAKMSTLVRS